ncbi:MAG: adenylate/guanylate cyclase domain-containing protein [Myxococcota bacterium]
MFYEAMARALTASGRSRKLKKLAARLGKMAELGPAMAGAMHGLVLAELARLEGRRGDALLGYEAAARAAAREGLAHLEGLALERAGRLSLEEGNQRSAETQLRGARFAYDRWGATAVVARLQDEFPFVAARTRAERGAPGGTVSTTGSSAQEGLDLEAAMRASRTLSSQISLADLIEDILRVVLQAAGAERGVLLLLEGDALVPRATLGPGSGYSEGIARVVRATGEPVVLDDAAGEGDFVGDPYVATGKPLSVLAAPLAHAGRLRGVVFLENNLTRGAFTADRLQLLQLLGAQAAVALENAQLVDDLEAKVRERTAQLELRNEYIRKTFGRYVSDDIVSALLDAPEGTELGGERRTLTVMMADLRGFSTAVRNLPPERVLAVINNFLEVQTKIVMRYGGTIDEVLGDALLVLFGAPVAQPDDADRAVACALAMQQAMAEVQARNEAMELPTLAMGIGLHRGEAVVGNIGTEERAKYGVVGAVVNLAARIESLTTGGQVLASGALREAVRAPLECGEERSFEPKGAAAPLRVAELRAIGAPYGLRLTQESVPLRRIEPSAIGLSRVDGSEAGPRLPGVLVAVAPDRVEVRDLPEPVGGDVRLYLDAPPDAAVYGKVVAESAGTVTIALTAASDAVREALEGR